MKKKRCTKCGKTKPLNDFYKDKKLKGGFKNQCKECKHKRERDRRENDSEFKKLVNKKQREYYKKKCKKDPTYRLKINKDRRERRKKDFNFLVNERKNRRKSEKKLIQKLKNGEKSYIQIKEKKCSRCKKLKQIEEFNKNSSKLDGHQCYCKQCRSEMYNEESSSETMIGLMVAASVRVKGLYN